MVNATDPDQRGADDEAERDEPQSPYQQIAAVLRRSILDVDLTAGQQLPALHEIMQAHGCSIGTAHRAVALLAGEGLVLTRRGFRAIVTTPEPGSGTHS